MTQIPNKRPTLLTENDLMTRSTTMYRDTVNGERNFSISIEKTENDITKHLKFMARCLGIFSNSDSTLSTRRTTSATTLESIGKIINNNQGIINNNA